MSLSVWAQEPLFPNSDDLLREYGILSLANGNILVYGEGVLGSSDSTDVIGRIFDPAGRPLGAWETLNTTRLDVDVNALAAAATVDGGFVLIYGDSGGFGQVSVDVAFERFDASGASRQTRTLTTSDLDNNGDPTQKYSGVDVTTDGRGNVAVIYQEETERFASGDFAQSYAVILNANGQVAVSEFEVGPRSGAPGFFAIGSVATLSNGDFAAVTEESGGIGLEVNYNVTVFTTTGGIVAERNLQQTLRQEILSAKIVPLDVNRFAVLYTIENVDSNDERNRLALYENDGTLISRSDLPGTPDFPSGVVDVRDAVRTGDGGFFALFGNGGAEELRRFDANGQQIGATTVTPFGPPTQRSDSLTLLADGRVAIIGEDPNDRSIETIAIYDLRTPGTTVTGTGAGELLTAVAGGGTVNALGGNDQVFGTPEADVIKRARARMTLRPAMATTSSKI